MRRNAFVRRADAGRIDAQTAHTMLMKVETGFIDMIQLILLYGQQQGDVRRDIPLEKLTRYVTMLYISHVSELLEIETLLEFLRSGLFSSFIGDIYPLM